MIVTDEDPIETVLTPQGWLSNGNMHPVAIHAQGDNDIIVVNHNRQLLDLNGDSGNDTITLFAYIILSDETKPLIDPPKYYFTPKSEDPDYVINSFVDVDGGTWEDR